MKTFKLLSCIILCFVLVMVLNAQAQEGTAGAQQDTSAIIAKKAVTMRTPRDVPAFRDFARLLMPYINIDTASVQETKCPLREKCYCMYYAEDPARRPPGRAFHYFGWYSLTVGCCALYPIVRGVYYDPCLLTPTLGPDPATVLPPNPAWMVKIPDRFGPHGFWLDNQYSPLGNFIGTGGLYFCDPAKNCDAPTQHFFIYTARYTSNPGTRCTCKCDGQPPRPIPPSGTIYLIFCEDWCHGGDWDWNDFSVALIPCGQQ